MTADLNKIKKRTLLAASIIFASVCLGSVIYYIIYPSAAYFHSDCSDAIFWAQASWDAKSLFNKDFGYAALLPFGGTTIMTPLVGIFGVSTTAQRVGMVLFTLVLFAAAFALCRSVDFGYPASFAAAGTLFAVLEASPKLREIFYEHAIYYSVCALCVCVATTLFIRYARARESGSPRKKSVLIAICAAAFSACAALDGVQIIATGIFPTIFAAAVEALLNAENRFLSRKNSVSFEFCVASVFSAVLGFLALEAASRGISAGYAVAYSSYSNMEDWTENLLKLPVEWIKLFGVDVGYGTFLFSLDSAINIIRLGTAAIVAVVPVIALILYKKFEFGSRILIFAHFGLSGVVIFGYVFGLLSVANWRLSPLIFTGVLVCFAAFEASKKNAAAFRFSVVALCVLLAMSAISLKTVADMDKNGIEKNEKYRLATALDAMGLNYGFATFWNSQAMTVLSDSKVETVNVDIDDGGITPCPYQTNKNWFEPKEGVEKYFVLVSPQEAEKLRETEDWKYFIDPETDSAAVDGYTVYIFKDLDFLN